MKDIFTFWKNPTVLQFSHLKPWQKFIRMVLIFVLLICLQITLQFIFLLFTGDTPSREIESYKESLTSNLSAVYILILGPLYEELTFRLALTKYHVAFFRISLALLIATIVNSMTWIIWPNAVENIFVIILPVALIIWVGTLQIKFVIIEKNWERYFKYFVWISVFIFSIDHIPQLLHVFNLSTLIRSVMSIMLAGMIYTYVRVRYGLVYAVMIHCLYNLITGFMT